MRSWPNFGTLAAELAEYGVRVNAVAPGPVETPMVRAMHTPASRAAWARTVPMRRYGEATEIAHAVAFLLNSGKSDYITGETLCVDGGFAAAGLLD